MVLLLLPSPRPMWNLFTLKKTILITKLATQSILDVMRMTPFAHLTPLEVQSYQIEWDMLAAQRTGHTPKYRQRQRKAFRKRILKVLNQPKCCGVYVNDLWPGRPGGRKI